MDSQSEGDSHTFVFGTMQHDSAQNMRDIALRRGRVFKLVFLSRLFQIYCTEIGCVMRGVARGLCLRPCGLKRDQVSSADVVLSGLRDDHWKEWHDIQEVFVLAV